MPEFPCLSIRQPHVERTFRGEKPIEYRTWRTHYVGLLAIHVSTSTEDLAELTKKEAERLFPSWDEQDLLLGHVIGIVDLVGC